MNMPFLQPHSSAPTERMSCSTVGQQPRGVLTLVAVVHSQRVLLGVEGKHRVERRVLLGRRRIEIRIGMISYNSALRRGECRRVHALRSCPMRGPYMIMLPRSTLEMAEHAAESPRVPAK